MTDRATKAHGMRRLLTFGTVGVLALAGMVALPDRAANDALDHRTGQLARSAAVVRTQAQHSGDARAALDLLLTLPDAEKDPELAMAVALLRAELAPPIVPTDGTHPLHGMLGDEIAAPALAVRLQALEGDEQIARQTEHFFAPSADALLVDDVHRPPDAKAAALLRRQTEGHDLDLSAHLATAAAFSAAGRPRARTRWMLRALVAHPSDARLRLQLAQTYCKDGRHREALALTSSSLPRPDDDQPFWQLRAQLASWLGQQAIEAHALERVLRLQPNANDLHLRLIELYAALGRADAANAHAAALADRSRAVLDRQHAVDAALDAGDARGAVDHLLSLIAGGHDVQHARERIVDIALLDLDYGQAITTLGELVAAHPEHEEYTARLETIYRRRDMAEPLADLLQQRFARQTADLELGLELLHLLVGLERRRDAEQVLARLQEVQAQPVNYFRQLTRIAATGALQREHAVETRAAELATSPALTANDLPAVLEGLRPLARQRRFKPTLEALAQRFVGEPAMQRFLLDLVETESDVEASVHTAEEVAGLSNEANLVREWVKRASWVGLVESERKARIRLVELDPNDLDNREALAWILTSAGDHQGALPQWRDLVEHDRKGEVAAAYVAALRRCGGSEEALTFLRAQAERADATLDERLRAADALLGANLTAAAAAAYERVLTVAPDHPEALLRLGQIKFWANDPGGALPLLERRLAMALDGDAARAQTHFALAEALTALGRKAEAVPHYELALRTLAATRADASHDDAELAARCLARLDRPAEAILAYREVLTARPDATDLRLDLADLLHKVGDDASARVAIEAALELAPDHKRGLRALADADQKLGDYGNARLGLERSLELHGADADVFAALAQVSELDGEYGDALDAYRRWLALRVDSAAARRGERDMFDRTRPLVGAEVRFLRAGRDHRTLTQAHGATEVSDRLRASVHVGLGDYSGRSPAVGGGLVALRETLSIVGGQLAWRFARRNEVGVGVELYPSAPGDAAAGWLNAHFEGQDPYAALNVRAVVGELWTDAAAGAALGARRDGGDAQAYCALGNRAWLSGELGVWSARARDPNRGVEVEDTLLQGHVAVGWRCTETSVNAVADRFRRDRVPTGPLGPNAPSNAPAGDWQAAAWLALQTTRLLGREELPTVLPVGDRFDYALLASRLDKQLGAQFGVMAEGFVGTELHTGDATWSLGAASSFRPSDRLEATLGFAFGDAMARQGAGSGTTSLFFQLHARW